MRQLQYGDTVQGTIRWYDSLSGEGVIRVGDTCFGFFACNVVGANSPYPFKVTNVSFRAGDKVTALISEDPDTVRHLGLINIQRAA
jgi:hypothetical protein